MAAGLGTRLRPFTDILSKPLLPLMGVPTAQFAVDALASAGVSTIVANVHHLADLTAQGLRGLDLQGATLKVSDERALLLGSAGGLKKAEQEFAGGPFFLLNSDVICDVDLAALAVQHRLLRRRWGVSLTLAVFPKGPRPGKYREILFDPEASLITGLGALESERPFFVGAAVLEPEALQGVPSGGPAEFVPTVLEPAIQKRRAGIFLADGVWHDIGSPTLWRAAHLGLIQALETGAGISYSWRKRLEGANVRIAPQCWIARSSRRHLGRTEFASPCYWRGDHSSSGFSLGPHAVLYGSLTESRSEGIGFGDRWVPISSDVI